MIFSDIEPVTETPTLIIFSGIYDFQELMISLMISMCPLLFFVDNLALAFVASYLVSFSFGWLLVVLQ